MQDNQSSRRTVRKRAFTLIELLVVIAIIAILAAILFPVFAQAKAAAKITTTISGMKQMALGLQMYSNDYDDTAVFEYGYADGSIPGDTDLYHYNNTWVGRIYPYVKNNSIFFDKTIPEITDYTKYYQDPNYSSNYYSYAWSWITSFSLNTDGYSRQLYSGSSCTDYGSSTSAPRILTAISEPATRLAVTPTRYGTISNWSWMRFISYYASWPTADAYASGFSWNQLVYDARRQYGQKFIGGFADGHAGKYGNEKFVKEYVNTPSQSQATSYGQWCNVMNAQNLFEFWGPYWSPN
jgi:prepilin-type N-terminal cleavage/methylation domain-containing protein